MAKSHKQLVDDLQSAMDVYERAKIHAHECEDRITTQLAALFTALKKQETANKEVILAHDVQQRAYSRLHRR